MSAAHLLDFLKAAWAHLGSFLFQRASHLPTRPTLMEIDLGDFNE